MGEHFLCSRHRWTSWEFQQGGEFFSVADYNKPVSNTTLLPTHNPFTLWQLVLPLPHHHHWNWKVHTLLNNGRVMSSMNPINKKVESSVADYDIPLQLGLKTMHDSMDEWRIGRWESLAFFYSGILPWWINGDSIICSCKSLSTQLSVCHKNEWQKYSLLMMPASKKPCKMLFLAYRCSNF